MPLLRFKQSYYVAWWQESQLGVWWPEEVELKDYGLLPFLGLRVYGRDVFLIFIGRAYNLRRGRIQAEFYLK